MAQKRMTPSDFTKIRAALKAEKGNVTAAAKKTGWGESSVRKVKRAGNWAKYQELNNGIRAKQAPKKPVHILDSNLTEKQSEAFLRTATDLQAAQDHVKVLQRTVKARDMMIAAKNKTILDLKAKLQNSVEAHPRVEMARPTRKSQRTLLRRFWGNS